MAMDDISQAGRPAQETWRTQQTHATQLRQWHQQPPILVLPNAWDAASARVFEQAGARAIATTSSGVAAALGYPDGEHMSRDLMIETIGRIAAAVTCPVTADIEAGYGDTVAAKLDTIERVVAAGAVGINIEDSTSIETGLHSFVDVTEQAELIQTIRAAAVGWGVPLVINARVDVYLHGEGDASARLNEAVRRATAYREAGADCVFPIGLADGPTIGELVRALGGSPVNILAGPQTPSIPELADLGVARVSVGGGLTRVALGAARRAAEELLRQGTFTSIARDALPGPDFRRLFAN